jgi:beta-glucosidase
MKTSKNKKRMAGPKARAVGRTNRLYRYKLLALLSLLVISGTSLYAVTRSAIIVLPPPPANALYKQASVPIDSRVDDLLSRMTLDEKIGQMALEDKNSLKKTVDISRYNLGGVLSGAGAKPSENTPAGWLAMISAMKQQARSSRLGIPLFYGIDANHGNGNVPGSTIFPHAIGLGAADDPALTTSVAAATAQEISATGANWSFSPSLDAPLDIRWGRVYEAFSDSPALNARLGAAYIEGLQNTNAAGARVLGTAKHYLGNGSMAWGESKNKDFKIDQGVVPVQDQLLDSSYLPPYAAASAANVGSVMIGLDFWGKTRIVDSKYLITDKLKGQIGFKGFVVSDWYGIYEYTSSNNYDATVSAINAGVDMAMLPYDYKNFIKDVRHAVNKGAISRVRIDDAVRRILYQKFKAGLFDIAAAAPQLGVIGATANRQLARQAVSASAVLLKNNGNLLPLSKNNGNVLVAGSGADNVGRQSGAWTVEWQGIDGNWLPGATSILQGMRQVVGSTSTLNYKQDASFAPGTKAAVGIAIVSEKPYAEGLGDTTDPGLDYADQQVIDHLKSFSDKVVVIVISGRPLLMSDQIHKADAVVANWLPGSEGAGVADVIFGNKPFSAKLPLPWPSSISQIPTTAAGKSADGSSPLFARGFGL